jgi:pimeloyl-ACP methyl ester carboxylesterase
MTAPLHTNEPDPVERLRKTHESLAEMKERHRALPAELLRDANQFVPPALFSRAARLTFSLSSSTRGRPAWNLVISNVPGPQFPLYMAGARMEAHYPISVITDGMGLNITVMSYCGHLDVGIVADREQTPDVWSLIEWLGDALDELRPPAPVPQQVTATESPPTPAPAQQASTTESPPTPAPAQQASTTESPQPRRRVSLSTSTGMAEQFCEIAGGITLCYERFGRKDDPPMLLIMGLGTQMIGWPDEFCVRLADRGFHVVRFDNRDIGRSTRMRGRPPTMRQLVTRRIEPVLYTLSDMAADAAGLLRGLGLAPAHVVGASMGGMIAQTLAAQRPECVRSLVSIMSTTGNRRKGQPAFGVYRYLLRVAPDDREGFIEHTTRAYEAIGSRGLPYDRERVRETVARSYDRGRDPAGPGRQLAAIIASGDRTAELGKIKTPTLVIHGSKDRMVAKSGGVATARAIPGARLMIIDGMGHDLPEAAWPRLVEAIAAHAHTADEPALVARSQSA